MSETAPNTVPPAPPSQTGTVTADQISAARAQWISSGLDVAKFDATIGAPPASATEPLRAPTVDTKKPSLSEAEAHEMADALRAAGVPTDIVAAAMKADGLDIPESKTPDQIEHDKDFGLDRPFKPTDYKISYMKDGVPLVPVETVADFNARATEWLASLKIDPLVGAGLIEHALKVGYLYPRMSDARRGLFKREHISIAERRLGGSEQVTAAAANTNRALAMGDPAFANMLLDSGALHDSFIFETLANHGERLMRWAETAPKKGDRR